MSVHLIYLPANDDNSKVGLDDFFATGKSVEDLLALARDDVPPAPEGADMRPRIRVAGGYLPESVDSAEQAMLGDGMEQLFQRGGVLVRPMRLPAPGTREQINRPAGALVLVAVDETYLRERFTRSARWERFDLRQGAWVRIDCPKDVAATYLARSGKWNVPVLKGVLHAPTLREDGSLLDKAGYDDATGMYLDIGNEVFAPVPANPSREDAVQALLELKELLAEFPFVARCDRSAALAGILTPLVRHMFPTAPMIGFRASCRGTGKSLLVDLISILAIGRMAAVMAPGRDEDEMRKRILAVLFEGDPIASIDNVDRELFSAVLCQILTQTLFKDRLLGKSLVLTLPTTTVTWYCTGNNIVFGGDLPRRVIPCDLDAQRERPEDREFKIPDIANYVRKRRPQLVGAALTVLRAYIAAGKPRQNVTPFGSFEAWSDLIRSALVWAGEADPCDGRERLEEIEPTKQQLLAVLSAWLVRFGSRNTTSSDLVAAGQEHSDSPLNRALAEVATDRSGALSSKRLGRWLLANVMRVVDGVRIERVGTLHGVATWRLGRVGIGDANGGVVGLEGIAHAPHEKCQPTSADDVTHDTCMEGDGSTPPNPPSPPDLGDLENPQDHGATPAGGRSGPGGELSLHADDPRPGWCSPHCGGDVNSGWRP